MGFWVLGLYALGISVDRGWGLFRVVDWRFYYRFAFRASIVSWGFGKYGLGSCISVYLDGSP